MERYMMDNFNESKTDLECIEHSLREYGDLTWDEIREKSHDYAWRSTALNTPISLDNLILETGNEESYIDNIKGNMVFAK